MKSYLISFATPKFYFVQDRLANSVIANRINIDYIVNYRENFLEPDVLEYCRNNPRGFGFWRWKSIILNDIFSRIDYGDRVLYCDSAGIILPAFNTFLEYKHHPDIVLFENKDTCPDNEVWVNKPWTKRDCAILMDCDSEKYWYGKQAYGGFQFYTKTNNSIEFLKEYKTYCDNHVMISDDPSVLSPEHPEFHDHRHDQTIISLLALKHDIELLSDPTASGNDTPNRKFPQLFNLCRPWFPIHI